MSFETRMIPGLFASAFLVGVASGQTITVTTALDRTDVPSSATMADLPGPDGVVSLREALRASDNEPGRQTIGFAIPDGQRWLFNIYPDIVLLQGSLAFGANDPVTIDGTTQTAFGGDINPDGHEIVVELRVGLNGDDSELFGFHGTHVGLGGDNSVIHDNTGQMRISVGPFNSGNVIRDNEAWVIELTYSNDNVVIRNVTERVRITGQGNVGPPASGNRIGEPDPADRNFITGFGNYGEHGVPGGDCIELFYTDNTLIQNNYIGTTPDGMAISNPACTTGIRMMSANDNVIVRDNLIAIQAFGVFPVSGVPFGQTMYVELYEGGTGIEVTGNTFGLNALGEPVLGSVNGILVSRYAFEFGAQVRIGGPSPGEGNVIAGHLETGVLMMNGSGITPLGSIRLTGNSIYANGDIGIDLMPNTWDFGPTPNDPLDADEGANGLQNYPDVATATHQGATLRVTGTLHSQPLGSFTLELFASAACDASGFGQAEVFLGSTSVSTDAAGDAAFDVTVPALAPPGWVVSATATLEPLGATSEFSACIPIEGGAPATFCDGTEATPCPCGNAGSPGAGCDIAQGTGGVTLALTSFSPDGMGAGSFVLEGTGYPPATSPTAVVIRSAARLATPSTFGDGLMCVAPPIVRLGATQASGGVSTHSGSHGAGAGTFHYQVWFRNEPAAFCDPLAAFNLSNGLTLVWP